MMCGACCAERGEEWLVTGGRGGRRDRDRLFGSHTRNGQPGQCGEALQQVEEMAGRHTRAARACHLRVGDHEGHRPHYVPPSSSRRPTPPTRRPTGRRRPRPLPPALPPSSLVVALLCCVVFGAASAVGGILRNRYKLFSDDRNLTALAPMRCALCSLGLCGVPARNSARAPHSTLPSPRTTAHTHESRARHTSSAPPIYHTHTYLTLPLQRLRLPAAPRRRAGQDGGGQQGGPRRPRRRPWPRQGDEGI